MDGGPAGRAGPVGKRKSTYTLCLGHLILLPSASAMCEQGLGLKMRSYKILWTHLDGLDLVDSGAHDEPGLLLKCRLKVGVAVLLGDAM